MIKIQHIMKEDKNVVTNKPYKYLLTIEKKNIERAYILEKRPLLEFLINELN